MNINSNIEQEQIENLENWLLKINKVRPMKGQDIKYISEYMRIYWRKDIRWVEQNNFMTQLPPTLRKKVNFHLILAS